MSQILRPYQVEAVEAIFGEFEKVRSTLLVLPTGVGKTTVFSATARRWLEARRGRVLVIAHREELIFQARERLASFGLNVGLEMGEHRVSPMFMPDVVVATVQTMSRASRREVFGPGAFGLVIRCSRAPGSTRT
jgi:superfamily II DNA or RNA helicase